MASRRWRPSARNRQIPDANDYGSGLFLLLLPPILALLCGPADQLFVDGTTETETPETTSGLSCAHQLELFVFPHGLYCKDISDDPEVPECVPIDPNGKCYTAAICFPSSRTNANLTNGPSWLTEYCELHKQSAAAIRSAEGNNFVWHGIGAKICASKEADDIVVNLEMATTFSAEFINLDKSTARFSTEVPYPGAMEPYLDVHPLVTFICNNNGVSASPGDCKATLYNGPDRNRTDVGNKLSTITTNDLSIALCEIGKLSPEQMYFTENVGDDFSKCGGVAYWTMDGKRMRSKECTFNNTEPGLEESFTKEEIQAYKQWIKEDWEVMCKCMPAKGKNDFCVLAENEVVDQDLFDRMPLSPVEEARKQLERKREKCGLESNLDDAAKNHGYSGIKKPSATTPATTQCLTSQHQSLELFVFPHGLYCKDLSDDPNVPECVPIDPNGKCHTAAICFPSSRTDANLTKGPSWVTEYCELHKPSAAVDNVWHGIGAKICASKEADDIVVNLEMASTFSAELMNFDKITARFSTEETSGDMAPYLDAHTLIAFDCNNNNVSSSGDCSATLYNSRGRNRTDVGNKLSAISSNDLSIALCEIGNLSSDQMHFTENVGNSSKCDAVIYWVMNGTRMRSKECTFIDTEPGIEDMFTKEEIQAYKQWIKEDREIMCKCLDKLQPPPPPGLVLPPEVVEQLNNNARMNDFCVDAEKEVTDQNLFDRMPLSSVEEARKQLERKIKKCGLESNLDNAAANWTWKSVPRWDGWKWDYKTFPIKYTYENIDDEKRFLTAIKKGIRLISDQTCVNFAFSPLVDENEPHLYYHNGSSCSTPILGRSATNKTKVKIGMKCRVKGKVAHETMHALGFAHEQKRIDRDDYIWVNFKAIAVKHQYQYEMMDTNNLNLGYDFGSVMHYSDAGFKTKGHSSTKTMYALVRAYQRTMGQRDAISFKDAKAINTVYCNHICQRQREERGSDICQNGGYLDPKNCERCKCPDGYGGDICQDVATSDPIICGDLDNELVASQKDKVYDFKFESKGSGRCYVRVWPKRPMNRVWITVTGMEGGFNCENSSNYVEIKYKADKAVTGPRIRCMEKDVPQKDYKFDTDNDTEIVLIFNMLASGLTVNFQYGAGGDVLGELKESCECVWPEKLFIPERNPGMSVVALHETSIEHECDGKPSGKWKHLRAKLQCVPWEGVYTLVNGKYRTHHKTDPKSNSSDIRETAIWVDCKALSNGESVWIYEDDKFGLVRVDDFMCIRRDA